MKLKIYYLITLCILFLSCNNSSEEKNDLEKYNLNGRVKSITGNEYYAVEKFGEILKGEKKITNEYFIKENKPTIFNEKGYVTEGHDNIRQTRYKYNEDNQVIEEDGYESGVKYLYKYNDKGFKVEFNNYYKGKLVQKIKFICDAEGNEIEKNSFEADGKLTYKEKNIFKDRKIIDSKQYDADGVLKYSINYKYDSNGNMTEFVFYDSFGKIDSKQNYKYDNKGNMTELVFYDSSGKIDSKKNYKYDENNQVTEEISYEGEGQIKSKYIYKKLDSNKNWTERIEFRDDKPLYIFERVIEYYK